MALDEGATQIAAVIAVLLAGRPYLPLDPRQPLTRQMSIVDDAGVDVLLDGRRRYSHLPDALRLWSDRPYPGPVHSQPWSRPAAPGPDELAYVIYTSGSAGRRKASRVSHHAVRATLDDIVDRFQLHRQDRVLGLSGLSFDLSVFDIFGTFCSRGRGRVAGVRTGAVIPLAGPSSSMTMVCRWSIVFRLSLRCSSSTWRS